MKTMDFHTTSLLLDKQKLKQNNLVCTSIIHLEYTSNNQPLRIEYKSGNAHLHTYILTESNGAHLPEYRATFICVILLSLAKINLTYQWML